MGHQDLPTTVELQPESAEGRDWTAFCSILWGLGPLSSCCSIQARSIPIQRTTITRHHCFGLQRTGTRWSLSYCSIQGMLMLIGRTFTTRRHYYWRYTRGTQLLSSSCL